MAGIMLTWGFLIIGCVYDLRYRNIPIWLLIAGGIPAVIRVVLQRAGSLEWIGMLFPGICLLAVAFLSGEKVGYGDGVFVTVLGMLEGGDACIRDFLTALLMLTVTGTVLVFIKKIQRDKRIPFLPFLFGAHILGVLTGA